jgi:hypothetical protein
MVCLTWGRARVQFVSADATPESNRIPAGLLAIVRPRRPPYILKVTPGKVSVHGNVQGS